MDTSTIAHWTTQCLQSFQSCLNNAALVHPRELSLVENQLARFSLWAANSMVFAKGRVSLDYRLREASDVHDVVVGLLEALNYRVKGCTDLLSPEEAPGGSRRSVPGTVDQALDGISKSIGLLLRLLNTIRKACRAVHNRKAEEKFRIQDEEGKDIESHLREMFGNYIRERYPGASGKIQERLASTMLLRRKQILYRRSRYGTVIQPPQQPPLEPQRPEIVPAAATPEVNAMRAPVTMDLTPNETKIVAESVPQTATALSPENFHKASAPSVMSIPNTVPLSQHEVISFPSAPLGSLLHGHKIREQTHRRLSRAMAGYTRRQDVYSHWLSYVRASDEEKLNRAWERCLEAAEQFPCPFCFCTLPAEEMMEEEKWRLHVLGDLDPYVCLFETCDRETQLFTHSQSWLDHMRSHVLRWTCSSKSHRTDFIATAEDEYLNHMQSSHQGKFTKSQLTVLAKTNARLLEPLFESCPLCGMNTADPGTGRMEDHVVGHLRKIAVHSLPGFDVNLEVLREVGSHHEPSLSSGRRSSSGFGDDDDEDIDIDYDDEDIDVEELTNDIVPLDASQATDSRELEWGFIPGLSGSPIHPESDLHLIEALERKKKSIIRMDPNCALCNRSAENVEHKPDCECEAVAQHSEMARAETMVFSRVRKELLEWVRRHAEDVMRTRVERHELRQFALQTLAGSDCDPKNATSSDLKHFPGGFGPDGGLYLTADTLFMRGPVWEKSWRSAEERNSSRVGGGGFVSTDEAFDSLEEGHSVAGLYHEALDYFFSLARLAAPDDQDPLVNPPVSTTLLYGDGGYGTSSLTPRGGEADDGYGQAHEEGEAEDKRDILGQPDRRDPRPSDLKDKWGLDNSWMLYGRRRVTDLEGFTTPLGVDLPMRERRRSI